MWGWTQPGVVKGNRFPFRGCRHLVTTLLAISTAVPWRYLFGASSICMALFPNYQLSLARGDSPKGGQMEGKEDTGIEFPGD